MGEQLLELDWAALVGDPPTAGSASRRAPAAPPGPVGLAGSFAAGVLFIATAFTDPTFVAVVILSAGGGTVLEAELGNAVWSVVSQLPLLGLMVALARGRDRVLAAVHRLRTRWGPGPASWSPVRWPPRPSRCWSTSPPGSSPNPFSSGADVRMYGDAPGIRLG